MDKISSLIIGKYCLEPLLNIRQDNIPSLLGQKPGIYICYCPEPEWCQRFGCKQKQSLGIIKKKRRMLSQMAEGSKLISPTNDVPRGQYIKTWQNGNVLHLAYWSLPGRLGQILQTIVLFSWLWQHRQEYEYCLAYDFYLPVFLAPLAVKIFLGKKLYVDYEDDYTKQRKNYFKNFLEKLLRKTVDGAICINDYMTRYFVGKPVRVFNAFADLKYAKLIDFGLHDNMIFLFSSTLDEIRGVELIPDLVQVLRQYIKNFKILITGKGPLRSLVEKWSYPEVKYLGFLNDEIYLQTMQQIDVCLVLQKPDHPFSLGSFPSKVDEYAQFKKPIFILTKV